MPIVTSSAARLGIAGTSIRSGVLLAVAGTMLGDLSAVALTAFGAVIFFFASAGASAAYLTASEVFPMETRALTAEEEPEPQRA